MTITTRDIPTPTWGVIPAGTEVSVVERVPGRFLILQGRRRSGLMTGAEVAEVTR